MVINGKLCKMELDTASVYFINISKSEYLERFAGRPLTPSKVMLKTYTGEVLDVSGEMSATNNIKFLSYDMQLARIGQSLVSYQ